MLTATAPAETGAARRAAFRRVARLLQSLTAAARRPVSASSVAVFRVGFGLIAAYSSIRFLAKGWVDQLYLAPENHLTYPGFDWVRPLPAPWMHLHLIVLAILGLAIAAGYHHRVAAALFVIGFTYTEMIDAALYLNHYWYVTLAGILLVLLPVHHHWSLDARARRVTPSPLVSVGVIWALRAQLGVVYLFAGLAKLNPDWILRAQPMRLWLADRTDLPVIGPILDEPAIAYVASWSGVLFDCTIVFWLLWRPSRRWAYLAVVAFHLTTGSLFQIGVFPWVMIIGTLVFFEPDWPTRPPASRPAAGPASPPTPTPRVTRPALVALGLLAAIEIILPLRHYAYPGNVRWTEEGYYLSWRVMVTEKAGHMEFVVTDPDTGRQWQVGPELVLTDWQIEKAATHPGLIQSTAHLIATHYRDEGTADVEVRADAWVSQNGRPARRIIDPSVDLAAQPRGIGPSDWIIADTGGP